MVYASVNRGEEMLGEGVCCGKGTTRAESKILVSWQ